MSKIVNSVNAFVSSSYDGYVQGLDITPAYNGNNFCDFQVNVENQTISCAPHQKIRCTLKDLSFSKSFLKIVNEMNNCFFVRNTSTNSLTPVLITLSDVVTVGMDILCTTNGSGFRPQVINSLVEAINRGLNAANPAWGVTTSGTTQVQDVFQCVVINNPSAAGGFPVTYSFVGHLGFINLPTNSDIVFIRDTSKPNIIGNSPTFFNRQAASLMGGFLNEIKFASGTPTTAEIAGLSTGGIAGNVDCTYHNGAAGTHTVTVSNIMPYCPSLIPLRMIYVRSNSLLPNGIKNNVGSSYQALTTSNIIARIPYTLGDNQNQSLDMGLPGNPNKDPGTQLPPNVLSPYSTSKNMWNWTDNGSNQFSFFLPTNSLSLIKLSLTDEQGRNLYDFYTDGISGGTGLNPKIGKNGQGIFATLKFEVLE